MYVDHAGNPDDNNDDGDIGADSDDSGIVECVLS